MRETISHCKSTFGTTIFLIFASNFYAINGGAAVAKLEHNHVLWKTDKAIVNFTTVDQTQFKLQTSASLRDGIPYNKTRFIDKNKNFPIIESGSPLFDSLYSLGIEELLENSVDQINDASFERADCLCFETGKKWNYVWTRDISYSAHLSLAALSPKRVKNSLLFKVSNRRGHGADSAEVVQDTGTGGSWPISTDRVVWSIAAAELLKYLDGSERQDFLNTSFIALKNTVDNDRIAIYDQKDGLYTGEQSFLDWRDQTYPNWTGKDIIHIGMSKALSTNINHYMALKTVSDIALELGEINTFKYYLKISQDLRYAINLAFWDEDKKLYSTFLTTYLNPNKVNKYDLLGNSLAVLFDIAETNDQKNCLENYPMVSAGAPVVWPQDQEAAIYHNRGIWPFVTQYALLAAKKSKQAKIYNHLFESMLRGAALNLSNMENFEFLSMGNYVNDGAKSGPVVNSQRQLWSVAGILSTYLDGIFGKEITNNGIEFKPFITAKIRNTILKHTNQISLKNFIYKKQKINIIIKLPPASNDLRDEIFYTVKSNRNGVIELGETISSSESVQIFNIDSPFNMGKKNYELLFAPNTPTLFPISNDRGRAHLYFKTHSSQKINTNIFRDGKLIAKNITASDFIDINPHQDQQDSPCYTIETTYLGTYNPSLPSQPHCLWANNSIQKYPLLYPQVVGLKNILLFDGIQVTKDGNHSLQVRYNNFGPIDTGITTAVKKIEVINKQTNVVIESKILIMPHHTDDHYWMDSNFISVFLNKDQLYTIKISDFYNMTYFEHFTSYLRRGGRSGRDNFVMISELKIIRK